MTQLVHNDGCILANSYYLNGYEKWHERKHKETYFQRFTLKPLLWAWITLKTNPYMDTWKRFCI